jgi:hypothetical protein
MTRAGCEPTDPCVRRIRNSSRNGRCRRVGGENARPLWGLVNERERPGREQKRALDAEGELPERVSCGLWVGSEGKRRKGVCARLDGRAGKWYPNRVGDHPMV